MNLVLGESTMPDHLILEWTNLLGRIDAADLGSEGKHEPELSRNGEYGFGATKGKYGWREVGKHQ